jgi:hypothetical protein
MRAPKFVAVIILLVALAGCSLSSSSQSAPHATPTAGAVVAIGCAPTSFVTSGGCQQTISSLADGQQRKPGSILVDAYGLCPDQLVGKASNGCRWQRHGGVLAGYFRSPKGPWGIAYAYNCGTPKRKFSFIVTFPNLDDSDVPRSQLSGGGSRGKGYLMETKRVSTAGIPTQYNSSEALEVSGSCAWHVRVVLGSATTVKQQIPRVPGTPSATSPSHALVDTSGAGTTTTATFTAPHVWLLHWAFKCPRGSAASGLKIEVNYYEESDGTYWTNLPQITAKGTHGSGTAKLKVREPSRLSFAVVTSCPWHIIGTVPSRPV